MDSLHVGRPGSTLGDGFGIRVVQPDALGGCVDVLEVAEALASHPAVEPALRSRAAQLQDSCARMCAPVRRIDRNGAALRVVSAVPEGVRLSNLLMDLERGTEVLTDAAALELAASVVRSLSALHQLPGAHAHGALSPAHVVLTRDAGAVLTDGIFGPALEGLECNREQLWREFGLALPPAAGGPRFDRRADVTALGTLVLALILRRPLRSDEYPRGIGGLVVAATPPEGGAQSSALRMWLERALQLHPRAFFGSADGAQRAIKEMAAASGQRREGPQAVRALIRRRCER